MVPIVGWHRRSTLRSLSLGGARRLPVPGRILSESWSRTGRPHVDEGLDVVHAPSLAFPARGRRPLVVTVHDVLFMDFPDAYPPHGLRFHRRALERLSSADLVICPSRVTADRLSSLARPPGRVRVVPLGTELTPSPQPGRVLADLRIEQPYVVWVGTLEPRKNVERVIRGFVEAVTSGPRDERGLKLYLVGPPGWDRGKAAGLLEDRGIRDLVRWMGPQPRERLRAIYSGAEALVFPSLGEGFGLPVLEAMACGTPVVASDLPVLREVAGEGAVFCDPTDASSIGEAITRLLADDTLADSCRRAGLLRAAELTWERTVAATAACYREVMEEAVGRSPVT